MKTISGWRDLEKYGVDALTGEACGLSYRLLCDVTTKGKHVLEKCLGLPELSLAAPWNQGSKKEPHIGSLMLAPEMLVPLGVFSLLESGCTEVWRRGDCLLGIEATDSKEDIERVRELSPLARIFRYAGTAGDRNVHVMSGRVT